MIEEASSIAPFEELATMDSCFILLLSYVGKTIYNGAISCSDPKAFLYESCESNFKKSESKKNVILLKKIPLQKKENIILKK